MRLVSLMVLLPGFLGCTEVQFRLLPDGSVTDGAVPQPNIIFVGSETVLPISTTRALADILCNRLAREAGIDGTFAAWYGLDGGAAFVPFGGSRGWTRPDGLPVADTLDDIKEGRVFRAVAVDENGNDIRASSIPVITGAESDGVPAGSADGNCDSLTDAQGTVIAGSPSAVNGAMFTSGTAPCDQPARVYCLGLGRSVAVTGP